MNYNASGTAAVDMATKRRLLVYFGCRVYRRHYSSGGSFFVRGFYNFG